MNNLLISHSEDSADGFITLPGRRGMLEETLETLTSLQPGHHDKLTWVLNIRGYCDTLSRLFGYACEGGFVLERSLHSFPVDETAEGLMQRMLTPR